MRYAFDTDDATQNSSDAFLMLPAPLLDLLEALDGVLQLRVRHLDDIAHRAVELYPGTSRAP